MIWLLMHPQAEPEHLGFVPQFFDDADPRTAAEQLNERYAHGGGWHPYGKGTWRMRITHPQALVWPGSPEDGEPDEEMVLIAMSYLPLTGEVIRFYNGALIAVTKPDGTFEVSRCD